MREDPAAAVCSQPQALQLLTTPVTASTTGIKWIGKEHGKHKLCKALPCAAFPSFQPQGAICCHCNYLHEVSSLRRPTYTRAAEMHQDFPGGGSSLFTHQRDARLNHEVSHFSARPQHMLWVKTPQVLQTPHVHPGPKALLMPQPQTDEVSPASCSCSPTWRG